MAYGVRAIAAETVPAGHPRQSKFSEQQLNIFRIFVNKIGPNLFITFNFADPPAIAQEHLVSFVNVIIKQNRWSLSFCCA